jgi:hypothetical protein
MTISSANMRVPGSGSGATAFVGFDVHHCLIFLLGGDTATLLRRQGRPPPSASARPAPAECGGAGGGTDSGFFHVSSSD